jgi:hypothetical protein
MLWCSADQLKVMYIRTPDAPLQRIGEGIVQTKGTAGPLKAHIFPRPLPGCLCAYITSHACLNRPLAMMLQVWRGLQCQLRCGPG